MGLPAGFELQGLRFGSMLVWHTANCTAH
jgi:hypothetical protein